ncbi:tetratricopeptide repeat protein [Microbacterium immunditiarum]|uniref:Orc1-like AAA ATPase domain-containing protein n=1 Tax=Microbacterium immunditiarum TaxID=337480 RepID=A0A7Y9KJY6_9MICO|nr:hypothetical protein [Microbacterium immunditiarum]NYE18653.1 hypothetical protein [Microbacterium immunditiarum]
MHLFDAPDSVRNIELSSLFTDRVEESEAFDASLAAHRRRLDQEAGESPRGRNVLVFHGMGGIGKSALSQRLEEWVGRSLNPSVGWGAPPATKVDATVRIDLHNAQGHIDGAERLAEMRIQLGRLKERWPLFDVAFAAYWAATHPLAPLPVIGSESGVAFAAPTIAILSALTEDRIPEDFDNPSTATSIGAVVTTWLADAISSRFRRRLAIDPPVGYDDLFIRCATEPSPSNPRPELLGLLASLLDYEIASWQGPTPLVVVFIDTFERVGDLGNAEGEALLNQVAYAMPHVLFVITGRDRLRWWDLSGRWLPHRGPRTWPLLVQGAVDEPRQHALELLSERDRRSLLQRIRESLDLPVSDDVLEEIADQSGGLPEYIRLAKESAIERNRNGLEITAEAVTGSLDDLVLRLLRDVTAEDEQAAIRAAALFPECTPALVAATASVTHGAAARALARPLFTPVIENPGRFTMHDRVRDAIRGAGHGSRGGWAEADWVDAGTRAISHSKTEFDDARRRYDLAFAAENGAEAAGVAGELLQIVGMAITVLCATEARVEQATAPGYADWLTEAVIKGPSIAGLRPFVPARAQTARGSDILRFIEAKSDSTPHSVRTAILRSLFDSSSHMSWIAGRHLAYAYASAADWDRALSTFDELIARKPENEFVRHHRALRLVVARRFGQALDAVPELSPKRHRGVRARIDAAHGKPAERVRILREAATRPDTTAGIKDRLEDEGFAWRWAALVDGDVSESQIESLHLRAASAGHDIAQRDAIVAKALKKGAVGDADLRWLVGVDRSRNDGHLGFREALVRCALAFASSDDSALRTLQQEISSRSQPRGQSWIPVDFLMEWLGYELPTAPAEWLIPREKVARRWIKIWSRWKERASSTPA